MQRTGEFEQRPRKRYDDTGLMVAELLRLGPDSPGGRAVIQRLNRIHNHYPISQADFAYVLSGFVAEPIRWLERYGWRALDSTERQALFRFWDHVGTLMGIRDRPANLAALLALNAQVEQEQFSATASNRRIANATVSMLLADFPAPLRRPLQGVLRGLLEPKVLASLGWQPTPSWLAAMVRGSLRLRSRLLNVRQRLRPTPSERFYSEHPTPSYGKHFKLEQLGPPPMLERLNSPRWSGPQRRIGLTGGIASGKSTVALWLAEQQLPILDADVYAREALASGSPGARAVLERYGDEVLSSAHKADAAVIDRAALGRIVFADQRERQWLEQLIHPIVRERFEEELTAQQAAPVVVLVIPLLFEAGLEHLCSEVWVVDCEPEQQLKRLMQRDGITAEDATARIAAQWPLAKKRALADRLIDNRGTPAACVSALSL